MSKAARRLVIAHRLSTIQRADRILVMHKRQLREIGTHQELLARAAFTGSCTSCSTRNKKLNLAGSSRRINNRPPKPPNYAFRKFGGLKVRHKLALLHNVFFFVLAVSVYLSVIPLF